jgi:hypothetical protein
VTAVAVVAVVVPVALVITTIHMAAVIVRVRFLVIDSRPVMLVLSVHAARLYPWGVSAKPATSYEGDGQSS